jgi:uncharacterized damage-inducible protein DinB
MTNHLPGRPDPSEYATYFQRYIDEANSADDINAALEAQTGELQALLAAVGEERSHHRYAEGKWSIRELVGHLTDAERMFGYRAMCIARGDTNSLPNFDEGLYAANAHHDARDLGDVLGELADLRSANVRLLRGLEPSDWTRRGTASGKETTPRALAYVMLGHVRHHMRVLRERYL